MFYPLEKKLRKNLRGMDAEDVKNILDRDRLFSYIVI